MVDCTKEFFRNFTTTLEESELREIETHLRKLRERAKTKGTTFGEEVAKSLKEDLRRFELSQAKAAISSLKYKDILDNHFPKYEDKFKAIEDMFHTSNKSYKEVGMPSVYRIAGVRKNKIQAEIGKFTAQNLAYIEELAPRFRFLGPLAKGEGGFVKKVNKKAIREIYIALKPGAEDVSKLDKKAREFAIAIKKSHDAEHVAYKNVGYDIGYTPDRILRQRHPANAIEKLGPDKFKDLAHKTWDLELMKSKHGIVDPDKFIDKMYEDIIKGRYKDAVEISGDFNLATIKPGKSIEASRVVEFKDGASFYDYNDALGIADDFIQDLNNGFERSANKIAMAERFGPNYRHILSKLKENAGLETNSTKRAMVDSYLATMDGTIDNPGPNTLLAKIGLGVRQYVDMTRLGRSLFTTITDLGFGAHLLNNVTGQGYLKSVVQIARNFVEVGHVLDKKKRAKYSAMMSMYMDDVMTFTSSRHYEESGKLGFFSLAHTRSMQNTGLPGQAHGMKLALAKTFSEQMVAMSKKGFSEIEPGMRGELLKFGFDEKNWDLIQHAAQEIDAPGGKKPNLVLGVTIRNSDKLKAEMAKRFAPEEVAGEIEKLATSMDSFLTDVAEIGSPTPGLKQKIMTNNIDPNTVIGQFLHSVYKFKSFILSQADTMARLKNTGYAGGVNMNGHLRMAQGLAGSLTFGLLALEMKSLAYGEGLRIMGLFDENITDRERAERASGLFADALQQSGVGLLWGDFLLSDMDKSYSSVAAMAAGPVVGGALNDLGSLITKALRLGSDTAITAAVGDGRFNWGGNRIKHWTSTIFERNGIPNMIVGQSLIEKMVYSQLQEWAEPGYLIKRERRKRKQGRTMWLPYTKGNL